MWRRFKLTAKSISKCSLWPTSVRYIIHSAFSSFSRYLQIVDFEHISTWFRNNSSKKGTTTVYIQNLKRNKFSETIRPHTRGILVQPSGIYATIRKTNRKNLCQMQKLTTKQQDLLMRSCTHHPFLQQ